jgi:hypothetical protein
VGQGGSGGGETVREYYQCTIISLFPLYDEYIFLKGNFGRLPSPFYWI